MKAVAYPGPSDAVETTDGRQFKRDEFTEVDDELATALIRQGFREKTTKDDDKGKRN